MQKITREPTNKSQADPPCCNRVATVQGKQGN